MNTEVFFLFLIFLILLFSSLSVVENRKDNVVLTVLLVAIFSLLVAVRPLEVPDTLAYIEAYELLNVSLTDLFSHRFEVGFVSLMMFVKSVFKENYYFLFLCVAIVNCYIVFLGGKKIGAENLLLFIIVYLSFYGVYYNFIFLREGLAFSLTLYAWAVVGESRLKAAFFILMAILFHKVAVIALLLLPLIVLNPSMPKWFFVAWAMLMTFFYILKVDRYYLVEVLNFFMNMDFLRDKMAFYVARLKLEYGYSARFIVYLFFSYIFAFSHTGEKVYNRFMIVYMCGVSLYAMLSTFLWVERISGILLGTIFVLIYLLSERSKSFLQASVFFLVMLYISSSVFFSFRIAWT